MITAELPKSYSPESAEGEIRARWDESGAFHATPDAPGEPYCIVIPPPNVTAPLHLGHAFNNTLQDILTRAHRMGIGGKKYNVLWMPGTDHAGIATQTVVEKRLRQQGIERREMGREAFVERVQEWKDEYEATIIEQLKAMGCSCDWDRVRFTMDEMCAKAVREAFFRLFKDGLIYRGKRLVNWDPVTLTALADDEVEMKEVQGHMWYLRYPLEHAGSEPGEDPGYVTVATTRPETMLGDTAVAINPKDPRADSLRGKSVRLPIVDRVIPIVEDKYVVMPRDMGGDPADAKSEIATGFLKVTPAHDPNDWEIGIRHDLPVINVMSPEATISDQHGWEDVSDEARQFVGMTREDARKSIVKWFKDHDLLEEIKDYSHSVGHSYRSHVPIEPYLSDQWYVKVTDPSWRDEALRAMVDEQYEGQKPKRRESSEAQLLTSRDRKGAPAGHPPTPSDRPSELNECAFFLTFTTYGTWLHGDERGSVDPLHNVLGTPVLLGDEEREQRAFSELKQPAMTLDADARSVVQDSIIEVCAHRGWRLVALHVRTNHVHCVLISDATPDRTMVDFKAYATRRLRERGLVDEKRSVWTRHGSTRYLNDDASVTAATTYVTQHQGAALDPAPIVEEQDAGASALPDGRGSSDGDAGAQALPYGRGSSDGDAGAQALPDGRGSLRGGDGELMFYPARYAKTFQAWHEGIRDWCISRQLWWGHRIPVWSGDPPGFYDMKQSGKTAIEEFDRALVPWLDEGRIAVQYPRVIKTKFDIGNRVPVNDPYRICVRDPDGRDSHIVDWLAKCGFTQDPDVLDTWFSSGLWPLSTMGWPDPAAYPETEGLLDTFNPSSVLITGRDIITLWVSRMVMYNRYLRNGTLPFRHVYINPMIQDGHGQRMSKSLGNGVDPRDIIHSHGADALRFTLCQIATTTQDVRLPVDMICRDCGKEFDPKQITSPAGYRVAAPEQACPKCGHKMVSAYGVATGEALPTDDRPLGMNSSNKFDLGRNFANKLWNAVRFALGNLTAGEVEGPPRNEWADKLTLGDRWIITRLHRTLHAVEAAMKEYQFNAYAEAMYDFIWRDFCDWYLEAIKPTVKENPVQQQVLRTVLNAALRLLHPICPFVTETLWPHVNAAGGAGLDGIELAPGELLATTEWPQIDGTVDDAEAADTFERARSLIETIRAIRGEKQVPPRKKIGLEATAPIMALIDMSDGLVQTIANLESVRVAEETPAMAVPLTFEGEHIFLTGMVDEVDHDKERIRLEKLVEESEKAVAGFRNKLQNENYTKKAPPNVVEQTRQMMAKAEVELEAARTALESLGG